MRRILSGLLIAVGVSSLSSWAVWGCLPNPDISLPDLAVGGPAVDGGDGGAPRLDGPSSDLGAAAWQGDSSVGTAQTLRAAWASDAAASEIYVVGHGGVILHRSAGTWQKEASGTDANLYAVAARSPNEIFVVGERGTILRRVSGTWMKEGSELSTSTHLFGAVVLPNGDVVAVGDSGLVVRRPTAGVWAAETAPALAGLSLRAVGGSRLDGLVAVGLNSAIVRRGQLGWDKDPLTIEAAARGNYYAVVESPADGSPIVAGEYGLLLSRLSDRWQLETLRPPSGMTAPLHLYGLAVSDGELFVVGAGGYVAHRLVTGGRFTEEVSGTRSDLFAVTGPSVRGLVAVGDAGAVVRRQ